jgi:predicted nucleotidyltransferase
MGSLIPSELRCALALEHGVELVLLFGSRAKGRGRSDSDVDIAVRASGVDLIDLARRISLALGVEVDLIDLESAGYPMLRELVTHGIVVAERVPGAAARWRSRALATLETDRPWFERMRNAYLARIARRDETHTW